MNYEPKSPRFELDFQEARSGKMEIFLVNAPKIPPRKLCEGWAGKLELRGAGVKGGTCPEGGQVSIIGGFKCAS